LIRGDATDAAYWRNFKTLEPTPGNETLSLMRLLPLSSTAASRLARDGVFPRMVRQALLGLVMAIPGLILFLESQKRHEIDLSICSGDRDIFLQLNRRYAQARSSLARAKLSVRRFLLWACIRSRQAGRRASGKFGRD